MSYSDPYKELELYLEQAVEEITKVFEDWNGECENLDVQKPKEVPSLFPKAPEKTNGFIPSTDLINNHNDASNESTVKYTNGVTNGEKVNFSDKLDNGLKSTSEESDVDEVSNCSDVIIKELNGSLSTINCSEPCENQLNDITNIIQHTATQTSPTPSNSSTNLTWVSDCSSSPCLTTASEPDLVEEDNRSFSSVDGTEPSSLSVGASASWKRRHQKELWNKSSSAPVLKKVAPKVNKQARSQSDRHLAEIEAAEACKWLRAAGFPQYAQMYEEMQFPVDIYAAQEDHPLLEPDVLHSLFRRLQVLNRCARVRQHPTSHTDDSEDEQCALSDNWTYQSDLRRWSRNCQNLQIPANIEEQVNKEWWCAAAPNANKEEIINENLRERSKDRLRRAASSIKFRRRREGVIINDNGSNVLDALSKQLVDMHSTDEMHLSDTECSRTGRRRKTRSLEKKDSWPHPALDDCDNVLWHRNVCHLEDQSPIQCRLNLEEGGKPISSLSCTQMQVLRKLALLKLTAHMEKNCPTHRSGWNWELPKFIRKMKGPTYRDKSIFGVPLTIILQRTGQPLPKGIQEALEWLRQNATDQVGLFRKPGVRSRIQALKNLVNTQGENINFNEHQAYDVADMVKQYFRELPEALLTNKLSEIFILIFQHVPPYLRREAVICALLLMPDEHREVLQVLLSFLENIASCAPVNQMNESNLALCFAPSLFQFSQTVQNRQNMGTPHPRELAENKAAQECLLYILKNRNILFSIPKELINQCKSAEVKDSIAMTLSELGSDFTNGWRGYLQECQSALLKETKEKSRGWVLVSSHHYKVELAYKKVADGHPLRLWKICAEIEAPPAEVVHRILRERHIWDTELHSAKIISQVDKNSEVFCYVNSNMHGLPYIDYCVIRTWKMDLPKGACSIVETSVEHSDALHIPNSVRGIVLASRYLVEPGGSGRSRLLHLSRVDTRGRMPEWYHKNYGHLCALHAAQIQSSFHQTATGPESKV
ncbi:rho GTPase-activating protein 7 [Agrilus planipennis]|uniref:Rho GTPase-activating protein 7 n=1 Tax=Agrilus planipennis TaxID=224129 RepID=A0A1W4WNV5_AGRPL|nr:rho GTPase-activating protein 7 [Agrilus planipennis]